MSGEELYAKFAPSTLGPWDQQTPEVRAAWENLAGEVANRAVGGTDRG